MLQLSQVSDRDADLSNITASKRAEKSLQELAESLQIPDSRYETANRAFKSVGGGLPLLAARTPELSLRGSFRHGQSCSLNCFNRRWPFCWQQLNWILRATFWWQIIFSACFSRALNSGARTSSIEMFCRNLHLVPTVRKKASPAI